MTYRNSKGKLHRIGGPAWEDNDGPDEWWIRGNEILQKAIPQTKEDWAIAILKYS